MNIDSIIFLLADTLLNAAKLSAPILLGCLAIGLLISLFQVVTQIQEMTLTFVPKLIAAGVILVFTGKWMLATLVGFTIKQLTALAGF